MLWQFPPPALSIQQLHVRVPLAILQAHLPAVEHQHNDDDENKGDHLPNKAQFSLNPQNHDDDHDDGDLFKEEEAKDGESGSEAKPDCCLVLRVVVIVVLVTS